MQIGNIDAITFCLSLENDFLPFNEELVRLLLEALALADAEDQALIGKGSPYKSASSLVSLRVVCIRLLSTAMNHPEFSSTKQESTRSRIIAVFFKSLYSKSPEIVDIAFKGLQLILQQQQKLPKNLLQAGLRPILVNLSDHKRKSKIICINGRLDCSWA
jgi:transformation/transcription domain-associated protein